MRELLNSRGSMKMRNPTSVLLVTEGTYPGNLGGVSEWCHRLVTGMPDVNFKILSLSSDLSNIQVSKLPQNVTDLIILPLWDSEDKYCEFTQESNMKKQIIEISSKEKIWTKWDKFWLNGTINGSQTETFLEKIYKKILNFPVPEAGVINAMNSGLAGLIGLKGKRENH